MLDSVSILISMGAVFISLYFGYQTLRIQRTQQKLDLMAARDQYFERLHQWSAAACDAMSEAAHLPEMKSLPDGEARAQEARFRLRSRLSSLADQGRYFFPNLDHPTLGTGKPAPFQGARHPAIDQLVNAHGALEIGSRKSDADLKSALETCKRKLLGEVHKRLDPKQREKQYSAFVEGYQA